VPAPNYKYELIGIEIGIKRFDIGKVFVTCLIEETRYQLGYSEQPPEPCSKCSRTWLEAIGLTFGGATLSS